MSTICTTFSQIAASRACVRSRVINLSQQSNRFLYIEFVHVSDQLRSNQIMIIDHIFSLMYHSSSNAYHESFIAIAITTVVVGSFGSLV